MNDYLVVRLANPKGIYYPRSFCLGNVEIRPPKTDTPDESECLKVSLEKNQEDANLNVAMRLAAIVEDVSDQEDAYIQTQHLFEEALDVLATEQFGLSSVSLMKSGFVRDLISGDLIPRELKEFSPSTSFHIIRDRFPQISFKEYLLLGREIEIYNRFLRSLHWSRHAGWEENLQIKILFNWFSIEALFKLDKDDDIVPKAMLSMGFPIGQMKNNVDTGLISQLESHTDYKPFRELIHRNMKEIRDFRNDSVHSGFRSWDISSIDLKRYSYLTNIACNCCQQLTKIGILSQIETAKDIWDNSPDLLKKRNNIINFVHGTLIYSLKNNFYLSMP